MKLNVRKSNYGFSTRMKNIQNGEEISMFMDVQFKKGFEPTDTALQIKILDGFMSCYSSQVGVKPKFVIKEYEILKIYETSTQDELKIDESSDEIVDIDIDLDLTDELPFE